MTVIAKTELGEARLKFTILSPEGLKGKSKRQLEIEQGWFGVKGEIEVTVLPTSVSFKDLQVVEKDEGMVIQQRHPDLAWIGGDHNPNPNPEKIGEDNRFTDVVLYFIRRNAIAQNAPWLTPQQHIVKYYYKCACHIVGQKKAVSLDNQFFEITMDKNPKAKITKFNVTFNNKN